MIVYRQSIHQYLDLWQCRVGGGGHLVVGSIKFVEGTRTEVMQRLAELIGGLEVASSFRDRSGMGAVNLTVAGLNAPAVVWNFLE